MPLLEFEEQMLLESFEENSLVIFAPGLNLFRHLRELIKSYAEGENFVVVTGLDVEEERVFMESILLYSEIPNSKIPVIVNAETSMAERKKIYSRGGVVFITGRILVVDFLSNRIEIDQINGLLICNAHRLGDNNQNAFICRLFRMQNRKGFIKAFSDKPGAFSSSQTKLEQAMRFLFTRNVSLWPRCRREISSSITKRAQPCLVEVLLTTTEGMKQVQFSIMKLIAMLLKEIAKANTSILPDVDDLTVESVITFELNTYYQQNFYGVWEQLDSRTKRNLQDIRVLKRLLFSLTSDDCVTFFNLVEGVRNSMKLDTSLSDWVFWNPAETLFIESRNRLFRVNKRQNANKKRDMESDLFGEQEQINQKESAPIEDSMDLERNTKWESFLDTIEEIKKNGESEGEIEIMVFVENDSRISKLLSVLDKGAQTALEEVYYRHKMALSKLQVQIEEEEEESQINSESVSENSNFSMRTQIHSVRNEENDHVKDIQVNIHFHSFKELQITLEQKIYQIKPRYFILYDCNVACIRTLELYQATELSPSQCKIYYLLYEDSAEQQQYYSQLSREKRSFENLVQYKTQMVVPNERGGEMGHLNADLVRGRPDIEVLTNKAIWDATHTDQKNIAYLCDLCAQYFEISINHRKTNDEPKAPRTCIACNRINRKEVIQQSVIVDMREFRCQLPAVIHKRGIDLIPATIEIGDYILSPDICVERKSIADLTQSLQSGRLFTQCKIMCRHYRKSLLLIEFDEGKSFSLKGKYWRTERHQDGLLNENNLIAKLILLSIHFPLLRIVWSPSTQFSGELFEELKQGHEQPDLAETQRIRERELDPEAHSDRYDIGIQDFLLNLPGLHLGNVYRIMNKVDTLMDLLKMSRDDLITTLGSESSGSQLFEAFHSKIGSYCANSEIKAKMRCRKIFTKIKTK